MRLTAISEALSKPLAEKVYKQLSDLTLASDQDPIPFTKFMTYVRVADTNGNMPHGNYILKIYSHLISNMLKKVQQSASEELEAGWEANDILPIALDLDLEETLRNISVNANNFIGKFDSQKQRIANAGFDTDINSYTPNHTDGFDAFAPIEKILKQLGQQSETNIKTRGLPGVKLLKTITDPENESNLYRLYEVTNPQSLVDIAMGYAGGDQVGWCTKANLMAQEYIRSDDNYVIFRNNQPTSQFSVNKIGPTKTNPFGELGKISEHKNSQNENERRPILQELANEIAKEKKTQIDKELIDEGLDPEQYKKMHQTVRPYLVMDSYALIKTRYAELRRFIDNLNLPSLTKYFKEAGLNLATTLSSIAGTYELGLPTKTEENEMTIKRKETWREIQNKLEESETFLQRITNHQEKNEQIIKTITNTVQKCKETDIKNIRLIVSLLYMNKNLNLLA